MAGHIRCVTRVIAIPAPAFDATNLSKYLNQFVEITGGFLGLAERWQVLQAGKSGAQS